MRNGGLGLGTPWVNAPGGPCEKDSVEEMTQPSDRVGSSQGDREGIKGMETLIQVDNLFREWGR